MRIIINKLNYHSKVNRRNNTFNESRKYSNDLETHLSTLKIKSFEFKKFRRIAIINRGSSATVYSANYQGNMFALKNLNMNLYFHEKEFKKFVRELNSLHNASHPNIIKFYGTSREKIENNNVVEVILGTPEDYANLYKSCMSSEPEERPSLDNILSELGRLSERRSIQSIINTNINNKPKGIHLIFNNLYKNLS
ncbi:23679_t:CDS:2 [Gigaspora margarita]|uniref:23679_t:CDS:1 n=1 Tax=Gigaspora margarita TaxID=4874 RepID=A0ABN7UVA5_GIGMA|nr:23679_t:CDS:2 [Gigaspora margarita]